MADTHNIVIAADASRAISAADKLTNAFKRVDSATRKLNNNLGSSSQILERELVRGYQKVVEATNAAASSFVDYRNKTRSAAVDASTALGKVRASVTSLQKEFTSYNQTFNSASKATESAIAEGEKFAQILTKISQKSNITANDLERLNAAKRKFNEKVSVVDTFSDALANARVGTAVGRTSYRTTLLPELKELNATIRQANAEYAAMEKRSEKFLAATGRLGDALFDVRTKVEKMDKTNPMYAKHLESLLKLETAYTKLNSTFDEHSAKQENLKTRLSSLLTKKLNLVQQIKTMRMSLDTATQSAMRLKAESNALGVVQTGVAAKVSMLTKQIEKQVAAQRSASLLGDVDVATSSVDTSKEKEAIGVFSSLGKSARSALYAVNAVRIALNLAFAASGLAAATRVVASFDQTLADLSSTIRPAREETAEFRYQMATLKMTMEELGATSRYTTTEAGQGMIYMAQAGLSASEIVQSASAVLDLAVASNTSLERSSDIVIQAMKTFDIAASEAWKVTDTLAVGAKESVTSIEQLANALHYVGPIAHTMGIAINETVAALGTLSDSGLQASMAGTGLRRIISEIVNPTYKAKAILDAAGLTMEKLDIQGLGLVKVLRNIKDANLSVGQSFAVWGDRGTPALQTILNNLDDFEKKLEKMKFSDPDFRGSAHRMREEREDTLSGQYLAAKSAIQEFLIKFAEYTNAIDIGKNILRSFAESLRLSNTDIGSAINQMLKWGSALAVALVTFKKFPHPISQTSAGFSKLSEAIRSCYIQQESLRRQVEIQRASFIALNATTGKTIPLITRLALTYRTFAASCRAAAVAATLLGGAFKLIASIAGGIILSSVVGSIIGLATRTDRATDAMERLKEVTELYFKNTPSSVNSATNAINEYAESLKSVTTAALETRNLGMSTDFASIEKKVLNSSLVGGRFLGMDMGESVFGVSSASLFEKIKKGGKEGIAEVNELIRQYDIMGIAGTKLGNWDVLPDNVRENAVIFVDLLRAAIVLQEQMLKNSEEFESRKAVQENAKAAVAAIDELSKRGQDARQSLNAMSQAMREMDSKVLTSALDKTQQAIYNLQHSFSTSEANELYSTFMKAMPTFDKFFDFDPGTLKTTLKRDWEELLKVLAEEQNKLTKDGKIKADFIKALGLDEASRNQALKFFNQIGEAYQKLSEEKLDKKLSEFTSSIDVKESITAIGTTAEDISKKIQEMFSAEDLSKLNIRIDGAFSEVAIKEGMLSDATSELAANVRRAIFNILFDMERLNKLNLGKAIENMNALDVLPKGVGKKAVAFAKKYNLDINSFNPATGVWGAAHGQSSEDISKLFKLESAGGSYNKVAKTLRQIANEQEELRLKYQQYVAEVTLGSTAEVDLAKLRLEKQKELSSLMEKASSLGLTTKDAEIAKTLKQIELTYALKEAEASRAAFWEMEMAKSEARLKVGQAYGATNWDAQKANLEDQLAKAIGDRNRYTEGSVGWINGEAAVASLDAKRKLMELDEQQDYRATSFNLMKETGSVQQVREAEAALIDLEIQRLQLKQQSVAVGSEEYQMYQKQIELQQLAKDKALDQNMFAAVPATLAQMKDQYSEWAMMSNLVTQSFDMMSEAVVNFITTGKFNFSEFTKQVGTMLIELTTKVMMFKAITSIIPGLGFANGGMANILAFADGGITNVKKFASGGMLTRPTLFNSSAGLALAGEAGYEHLMPAARLSNGKWGVYAEGMGGNNNQFVINTNINVEGGSSGNSEDDNKLAATISEKVSQSIKDTVKAELVQQMRAGGLLNSSGNRRW